MKSKFNHIQDLCLKYDAGKSSLKEELELEQFFAENSNIPAELSSYAAEFGYYASSKSITTPADFLVDVSLPKPSFWSKLKDYFLSKVVLITALSITGVLVWYYASESYMHETNLSDVPAPEPQIQEPEKMPALDDTVKIESSTSISSSYTAEKQLVKKEEKMDGVLEEDSISLHASKTDFAVVREPSRVQAAEQNPDQILPRKPIDKRSAKDSLDTKFTITQNSSSSELARIARLASNAGIEYTYVVDMRKQLIHELNIVMVIRSTGERSQLWIAYPKKTSTFSEVIGWNINEDGMATSLSKSKIEHAVKPKHSLD